MRTIGLIGGMSWESSAEYYRIINEETAGRLGGTHSAKSVMVSVDFGEVERLQHAGRWDELATVVSGAARACEAAGAGFVVLCTNTMHKVIGPVSDTVGIPVLHIADATAREVTRRGVRTVGLLGTRFTMEEEFYRGRLESEHGLSVIVPEERDRALVHRVIYEELVLGRIDERSRQAFVEVVDRLGTAGAGGVILGCTEIGLLLRQQDVGLPLFDTTRIHALAAVDLALAPNESG